MRSPADCETYAGPEGEGACGDVGGEDRAGVWLVFCVFCVGQEAGHRRRMLGVGFELDVGFIGQASTATVENETEAGEETGKGRSTKRRAGIGRGLISRNKAGLDWVVFIRTFAQLWALVCFRQVHLPLVRAYGGGLGVADYIHPHKLCSREGVWKTLEDLSQPLSSGHAQDKEMT